MTQTINVDTGTGYGRKTPSYNARLTEVGPGTPMGEAMRRYWHPIASSAALKPDVPHRTRVLGEDLIVFRDGQGRPGVVFERCAHRGSSLFYGRIEEDGIRCCYHGWKFDVQGHCLEQACEPGLGRRRDAARQPWYPVEERYGLVFVYMGPPDRKPALPRYAALEYPEGVEGGYQASMPIPGIDVTGMLQEFNWLQIFENALDPAHAPWLHFHHSGKQFDGELFPENFYDPASMPERTRYAKTEYGAKYGVSYTDHPDIDREWVNELHWPNIVALPDFVDFKPGDPLESMVWIVPSDDTSHRFFLSIRTDDPVRLAKYLFSIKQNGKNPWELTDDERQRFPGDGEAQGSQGAITLHSEETLATTDRGVVMVRRALNAIVDDVEAGRNPVGWAPPGDETLRFAASAIYTPSEDADPATTRSSGHRSGA